RVRRRATRAVGGDTDGHQPALGDPVPVVAHRRQPTRRRHGHDLRVVRGGERVADHAQPLRPLPQLATPAGMVFGPLTAEEIEANLQVAPNVVALAQGSPGTWYSLTFRRFLDPTEGLALEDGAEGDRDAA